MADHGCSQYPCSMCARLEYGEFVLSHAQHAQHVHTSFFATGGMVAPPEQPMLPLWEDEA